MSTVWVLQVPSALQVKGIICWPQPNIRKSETCQKRLSAWRWDCAWREHFYKCWVNRGQHNIFDIQIFPINRAGTLVLNIQSCSTSSRCNFFCLNHSKVCFVKKRVIPSKWKLNSNRGKILTIKACESLLKVRFSPIWHNKLFYCWTESH